MPDSFPSCDAVHVAPSRTLALAAVLDLREADLEDPLPDHLPEQPRRGVEAGLDDSKVGGWLLAVGCWQEKRGVDSCSSPRSSRIQAFHLLRLGKKYHGQALERGEKNGHSQVIPVTTSVIWARMGR